MRRILYDIMAIYWLPIDQAVLGFSVITTLRTSTRFSFQMENWIRDCTNFLARHTFQYAVETGLHKCVYIVWVCWVSRFSCLGRHCTSHTYRAFARLEAVRDETVVENSVAWYPEDRISAWMNLYTGRAGESANRQGVFELVGSSMTKCHIYDMLHNSVLPLFGITGCGCSTCAPDTIQMSPETRTLPQRHGCLLRMGPVIGPR